MSNATMPLNPTGQMTINAFMVAMREQFGHFEFFATSPKGHEVKSDGWKSCPYKLEVPATPYEYRGKK